MLFALHCASTTLNTMHFVQYDQHICKNECILYMIWDSLFIFQLLQLSLLLSVSVTWGKSDRTTNRMLFDSLKCHRLFTSNPRALTWNVLRVDGMNEQIFFTRSVNIDTLAAVAWAWQTLWPAECQQWHSGADVRCEIHTRQQNEDDPSVTVTLSGVFSVCPSGRTLLPSFRLHLTPILCLFWYKNAVIILITLKYSLVVLIILFRAHHYHTKSCKICPSRGKLLQNQPPQKKTHDPFNSHRGTW